MRHLIPILFVLAACGGDNRTPTEAVAIFVCDNYCETCDQKQEEDSKQQCSQRCFDQWSIFGQHADIEKADCAEGLIIGRNCQYERSCNDPACGDPFPDMERCIEQLRDKSELSE